MITKKNYKHNDVVELVIDLADEQITLFGDPEYDEFGIRSEVFTLFTYEEYIKLGMPEDKCLGFFMPKSNFSANVNGGFLSIFRDNKLMFMENRNNIKRIRLCIDENYIDLSEDE